MPGGCWSSAHLGWLLLRHWGDLALLQVSFILQRACLGMFIFMAVVEAQERNKYQFHKYFSSFCLNHILPHPFGQINFMAKCKFRRGGHYTLRGQQVWTWGRVKNWGHVCNLTQGRIVIISTSCIDSHLSEHKRIHQPGTWEGSQECGRASTCQVALLKSQKSLWEDMLSV